MIVFNLYFVHFLLEFLHSFCLVIDDFKALLLHYLKIFPNRHQTDRLAKCIKFVWIFDRPDVYHRLAILYQLICLCAVFLRLTGIHQHTVFHSDKVIHG